jgi:CRP/FNR family transcriptional regulator, nitrogen fixation regulation protein
MHAARTMFEPSQEPRAATGGGAVRLGERFTLPGFVMAFARNEEIFGEEEDADFIYKVISGAVRTVRILSDGRRQIGAFHLAGEVFGVELGATHRFSAEAVGDCQIALIRRAAVNKAADQDMGAGRALWALAAHDLQRLQDHVLLLGRKCAAERVGAFLLDMAVRTGGEIAVELPMSRTDMADYLGLTIETVSRTLTQLERDGVIAMPTCRHIELRNRAALDRLEA